MQILPQFLTRVYVFATLADALASTQLFGFGSILMIKGDNTKFKLIGGVKYSGTQPSGATSQTFSQVPWTYTDGATSKTPFQTFAQNTTGTITAANLLKKYITSTSAAAVALTLPLATDLGTALGAVQGTEFDFTVDNSGGANTVTVTVNTGIVAATPALTGGATLTVAAGTLGKFKIIFKSATTALIFRTL